MTRRNTFAILTGAGLAARFVPAWNETVEAADSITCVPATPAVTEGPYWVDEKLFRSDIRTDPATGQARAGIPLTLSIAVQNLSGTVCAAVTGAYVDIWHCDAKGIYSDEPSYNPGGGTGTVNTTGQKFLRGYQITDSNGLVQFTTIYPGWYSGRTIHIHVRVRTYTGSTLLGNFVSQVFFDESINNTVLATSAYSRSSSRTTTNANDMVYQVSNKERMLATTTGDASSGYQAQITIGASIQVPAAAAPSIAAGGVANAVSGAPGVSAGSWIAIYGTNLALAPQSLSTSDLANNTIPTSLGGASVRINGKPAFMQYVSPTQLNVLAPDDAATGSVAIVVTNAAGTSNSVTAVLQTVLPGLAVGSSNYVRALLDRSGQLIDSNGSATPGHIVSLYGTGFGPTTSTLPTGAVFSDAFPTTNTVTVTIGGVPANVLWAGLVAPGLYQINLQVPSSLGSGDYAIIATVAASSTQSSALLKITAS